MRSLSSIVVEMESRFRFENPKTRAYIKACERMASLRDDPLDIPRFVRLTEHLVAIEYPGDLVNWDAAPGWVVKLDERVIDIAVGKKGRNTFFWEVIEEDECPRDLPDEEVRGLLVWLLRTHPRHMSNEPMYVIRSLQADGKLG